MKKFIPANRAAIRQLARDLQRTARPPAGNHLSTEEMTDFALGQLAASTLQHLENHLASCEQCLSEVEHIAAMVDAFESGVGRAFFNDLRRKIDLQWQQGQNVLGSVKARNKPNSGSIGKILQAIVELVIPVPRYAVGAGRGKARSSAGRLMAKVRYHPQFAILPQENGLTSLRLVVPSTEIKTMTCRARCGSWNEEFELVRQMDKLQGEVLMSAALTSQLRGLEIRIEVVEVNGRKLM